MAVDSRAFTLTKGEHLATQFTYKKDGIDQVIDGVYTVSHFTKIGEDSLPFGTVSIIPGVNPIPDKVRFELSDSDSGALAKVGRYYGTITLTNIVDLIETVDLLDFNILVHSVDVSELIPIAMTQLTQILQLGSTFDIDKLQSVMRLAQSRIIGWLPESVITHTRDFGWPDRLIAEAEYCTAMMIRVQIYEDDQFAIDELKMCKQTMENYKIDSDNDGTLDLGGVKSIPILRHGERVLFNERSERYSTRFRD